MTVWAGKPGKLNGVDELYELVNHLDVDEAYRYLPGWWTKQKLANILKKWGFIEYGQFWRRGNIEVVLEDRLITVRKVQDV